MNPEKDIQVAKSEIDYLEDLMNLAVQARSLIVEEGFTEAIFRNPTTGAVRIVTFTVNY